MKESVYVLGINESHGATAALLKDGEIIAAASEERFTRQKNASGYPQKAIQYCLTSANIPSSQVTHVAFGYIHPLSEMQHAKKTESSYTYLAKLSLELQQIANTSLILSKKTFHLRQTLFTNLFLPNLQKKHKEEITKRLSLNAALILHVDHQTSHGYAAYYAASTKKKKTLVITSDGAGDTTCSKIFLVENDTWTTLAETPNTASLGLLYLYVTKYLGMKPNEHEYKVMGLAPYVRNNTNQKALKVFQTILSVNGLQLVSKIPHVALYPYLEKNLKGIRFDYIAEAIQIFTEDLLIALITNAIKKTGIHDIILGGGVFMNVKANMRLSQLKNVNSLFVMPTPSDESVAIGAAYYAYKNAVGKQPKPLASAYLGPSFTTAAIEKSLAKFRKSKACKITKVKNITKKIAQLLEQDAIVAHFAGRMEYGARALGNRSIFARPDNPKVIRIINDQIKGRDFWMPFAPVILDTRASDYLVSDKPLISPFMMIGFQTTALAQKELIATLHPYDLTARPQILTKNANPHVYKIIKEFEKLTGIGGLLNTSLNIHGEPIVCTPEDAIHTFKNSGLRYLVLEDYLLEKYEN